MVFINRVFFIFGKMAFHPILFFRVILFIFKESGFTANFIYPVIKLFGRDRYFLGAALSEKIDLFIGHFNLVRKISKEYSLEFEKLNIWRHIMPDNSVLNIEINKSPEEHSHEGELDLLLYFNDENIVTISFVFDINLDRGKSAIFVTRMQGAKGKYGNIRLVNKYFHDMNSTYLLVAALEGICVSLEIQKIYVVSDVLQLSNGTNTGNFISTYNKFLTGAKGYLNHYGFYELEIPLQINKLEREKTSHKTRHKKHILIRKSICTSVIDVFKNNYIINN